MIASESSDKGTKQDAEEVELKNFDISVVYSSCRKIHTCMIMSSSLIESQGVLNLTLGRGCRLDLETLTLFMIKSS